MLSSLSAAGLSSSCALKGPCYPVLTSQANQWHTCQTQKLTGLPLSSSAVDGLTTCISCCEVTTPSAVASCTGPLDPSTGVNSVFQYSGVTGPNATANQRINCLQSCQSLHGTIDEFASAEVGSIHPLALALFQATCAAANTSAAAVPAPATADNGAMTAVLSAMASTYKSTALRYIGDMMIAWKALVVCGLFLPFMLSFVWLFAIRVVAAPIVWMTVLCVDIATLGVTLYCFSKAGAIGKNSFTGIVSYSDAGGFSFNATNAALVTAQLTTVPAGAHPPAPAAVASTRALTRSRAAASAWQAPTPPTRAC